MASKIPGNGGRVELSYYGMSELLKSKAIEDMLVERMRPVEAAVPGSAIDTATRPSRVVVKVINGTDYDEANTGNLTRALDLSGGLRGNKTKFRPRNKRQA